MYMPVHVQTHRLHVQYCHKRVPRLGLAEDHVWYPQQCMQLVWGLPSSQGSYSFSVCTVCVGSSSPLLRLHVHVTYKLACVQYAIMSSCRNPLHVHRHVYVYTMYIRGFLSVFSIVPSIQEALTRALLRSRVQ